MFPALLIAALLALCLAACASAKPSQFENLESKLSYEVLQTYPHDPTAYTQGLVWRGDHFIEGTGLYGESVLRKVSLEGEVLQNIALPPEYFGEGITELNGKIYQLTWKENTGFIYDAQSLEKLGQFSYPTEGWGLTTDGEVLILSDGSSKLFFYQPEPFELLRELEVNLDGQPVTRLNELEWIKGSVFANIWLTDTIVRVDPKDGRVLSQIDLSGLRPQDTLHDSALVLNGIAYDEPNDKLFVTGKKWDKLFEIRLVPAAEGSPGPYPN